MDNVSAIIVTRGDDVDLTPILEALPDGWEQIVWDNSGQVLRNGEVVDENTPDLSVYGRYAAIEYASHEIILTQDDDCIVSDPQAIVDRWQEGGVWPCSWCSGHASALCSDCEAAARDRTDHVVCNMPERFRGQGIYATNEHALVGFGAAFHRDAPGRAFEKYWKNGGRAVAASVQRMRTYNGDIFRRTCDIVFTALTPRVLVDVPHDDLPWAHAENRMWKQREHVAERTRMLELVRRIK